MQHQSPPTQSMPARGIFISLGNIVANYRTLALRAAPARCAAVVKADAYGLGAEQVATALADAGCADFFVAQMEEGVAVRMAVGAGPRIHVLNDVPGDSLKRALAYGLIPVINTHASLERLAAHARASGTRPAMALQVDTGMSRLGIEIARLPAIIEAGLLGALDLRFVMSHLACADDPDPAASLAQRAEFERARALLPGVPASLANTAGIYLGAEFVYDLVRPGAGLYGLQVVPAAGELRQVVSIKAPVLQVRTVEVGTAVGYSYTYRAKWRSRVATIGWGYADGWLRSLSGRGAVEFAGERLPIVGRVSMDSFCVDATALPPDALAEGATVDLMAGGPDEIGSAAGTIGYEILTGLSRRSARIYTA